jgi:hypothetical protein
VPYTYDYYNLANSSLQSLGVDYFPVPALDLGREDLHVIEAGEHACVVEVEAVGLRPRLVRELRLVGVDGVVLRLEVGRRPQGEDGHQHSAQDVLALVEAHLDQQVGDHHLLVLQLQLYHFPL